MCTSRPTPPATPHSGHETAAGPRSNFGETVPVADVAVGIDIGTTSVKAVAADADGTVLARARVPHDLVISAPDRLEHRPDQAWRDGVVRALSEVVSALEADPVVVLNVAAMVPSLCAVDAAGSALTPGLLYGDGRAGPPARIDPSQSGELLAFLTWCVGEAPQAHGYWSAQAMANHALGGEAVIDSVTAMTAVPLFDYQRWDPEIAATAGADVDWLPRIVPSDQPAGRVLAELPAGGALLGGGTVDAFAEQLVAGADHEGDVLVICGTTLITWAVIPTWQEVDGLWTVPHSAPGKVLIGGPSNAGGLFLDRIRRMVGDGPPPQDPHRVPVWVPYIRGERTPLHDPTRRAALHDLDLTHDAGCLRRAAYEAAGFVVRHHLDLAGVEPRRIVATGGGSRIGEWLQALADCTGLPVEAVAVPEGAALGAAFLARVVAGLETSATNARSWARSGRRVEPDPAWVGPAAHRYQRFRTLAAGPGG
jgi:xylulokinase